MISGEYFEISTIGSSAYDKNKTFWIYLYIYVSMEWVKKVWMSFLYRQVQKANVESFDSENKW